MCCDGTLYSYVTLIDDEEGDALKAHDSTLQIAIKDQRLMFDQPCRFHNGSACTVYASRPDTCSRYFCHLLRSVKADELTTEEGFAIIQEAKALVENVKEYVEFDPTKPLAVSTWESIPENSSLEGRQAWERSFFWLRKHFLGPDFFSPEEKLAPEVPHIWLTAKPRV